MYCSNCGNKLNELDKFCSNCGKSVDNKDNNKVTSSGFKETSLILGILCLVSSFILNIICIIPGIISIIYAKKYKNESGKLGVGFGLSIAGIIFSILVLIITIIFFLLAFSVVKENVDYNYDYEYTNSSVYDSNLSEI